MIVPEIPANSSVPFNRLPAALLSGFPLVPRVRSALRKLEEGISLVDVQRYLSGNGDSDLLKEVARTEYEKQSLADGYARFISTTEESCGLGRSKSEQLTWIIPNSRLTTEMEIDSQTTDMIAKAGLYSQLGQNYQSWLPWVSLGIVNLLRIWRQPRVRTLGRAMFKLSGGGTAAHPWDAGYVNWQLQLPMHTLYKYEPSPLVEGALSAFSNLGLTSINDLRCCHPEAVIAAKRSDQPLFTLYRMLRKDDS